MFVESVSFQAIASRFDASRLEAIAIGWRPALAIASRLEAIASGLEAIAFSLFDM